MGDDTEGIRLPTRTCSRLRSNVEEVTQRKGAYQLRLQSKPPDGQQVEPAPEEPVNGRGHKARESNWELAREFPSGSSISNRGAVVRDRIYVSSRTYQSKTCYLQTRWSPYTAIRREARKSGSNGMVGVQQDMTRCCLLRRKSKPRLREVYVGTAEITLSCDDQRWVSAAGRGHPSLIVGVECCCVYCV